MRNWYGNVWWNVLAEGYGQAIVAANHKKKIQAAFKRLGGENVELVAHHVSYGDPYEDSFSSRGGPYTKNMTLLEVLEDLEGDRWGDVSTVTDWKSLRENYHEVCEHDCGRLERLLTVEESEKYLREEKRKEMESYASQFARSHNVGVNSMEFLEAIHAELEAVESRQEDWNSGEARMERMGACIAELGSAYGSEIFYDDNNFENGRFGERTTTLYDLLEWLGEACPLLMAQYQESKLVG